MKSKAVVLALGFLLVGCATLRDIGKPNWAPYGSVEYPPKAKDAVVDIYDTQMPKVLYIEIGHISKETTDDQQTAMKDVLVRAREKGADGIIFKGHKFIRRGDRMAVNWYMIDAVAIKYKE
ncbi:MAG: hypothetical protein CVT48_01115 [Thermoplasmata archaeon HGW-Thermoplasmata-1]|nr:MAG: hypothetical protein CVT48_01115 [Thermoplasmata archaeon HGW-Thermoplasmata-1]